LTRTLFASNALLVLLVCGFASQPGSALKNAKAQADLHGDPLPEGALARLGTVRFRHGILSEAVAIAPEGNVIASAGSVGSEVWLWDAATGRSRHRVPIDHNPGGLAFSPDGKTLFVGGSLEVIDVPTATVVHRLAAPGGVATCQPVAFSPNGKTVAAGEFQRAAGRRQIILWDAMTAKELGRLDGHTANINAIAFARDGAKLVSCSEDKTVRLWDVTVGKELRQFEGHDKPVQCVAYSPCGKMVASAADDRVIRLWDVEMAKLLHRMKGAEEVLSALAFSPDGTILASAGGSGTIRLWDPATGKELRRWLAHTNEIPAISFSKDGKRLASVGSFDHAVRLWDTATGKEIDPEDGHSGAVQAVLFTADDKALISLGRDRQLMEWDLTKGKKRRQLSLVPPDATRAEFWDAVDLTSDGKTLAEAPLVQAEGRRGRWDSGHAVHLWEIATGKPLRTLSAGGDWVWAVKFSLDGNVVASGSPEGVRLWDVATGQEKRRIEDIKVDRAGLAFAPDGRRMAAACTDNTIRILDVMAGKELRRWPSQQKRGHLLSCSLMFSPDGKSLASFGRDAVTNQYSVRVWAVANNQELLALNTIALTLAFSPSGGTLALAIPGKRLAAEPNEEFCTIQIWELRSRQLIREFDAPQGTVWSLAFSADGRRLASGGGDSTILVWDVFGTRDGALQSRVDATDSAPSATQ
jgi:WD40 repeat protein